MAKNQSQFFLAYIGIADFVYSENTFWRCKQNYHNDATVQQIRSLSKSGVYPQETLSRSKKVVEINNLCIIGSWEDDKDQQGSGDQTCSSPASWIMMRMIPTQIL